MPVGAAPLFCLLVVGSGCLIGWIIASLLALKYKNIYGNKKYIVLISGFIALMMNGPISKVLTWYNNVHMAKVQLASIGEAIQTYAHDNGGWTPPLYEKKWEDRSLCDYPANIVAFEEDGKTKYSGLGALSSNEFFYSYWLLDPRLGSFYEYHELEKRDVWKSHFGKGSAHRLNYPLKDVFPEKNTKIDYSYVFSTYTLRDFRTEWGNINLNDVKAPKAIASSLLIFSKEGDDDFFYQFSGNYRARYNIHNGKFFVAFTNGEVKVFKDKKGLLSKELLSDPGKENYEKKINEIFEKYFDTMR